MRVWSAAVGQNTISLFTKWSWWTDKDAEYGDTHIGSRTCGHFSACVFGSNSTYHFIISDDRTDELIHEEPKWSGSRQQMCNNATRLLRHYSERDATHRMIPVFNPAMARQAG